MSTFPWEAAQTTLPVPNAASPWLRRWCSPQSMLVIDNCRDEELLLMQVLVQAKQSRARILLAHVAGQERESTPHEASLLIDRKSTAQPNLSRMADRLRWMGISCQSLTLWGPAEEEIPSLARRCKADRVLIATQREPGPGSLRPAMIVEKLLPRLDVPVCIVGDSVPAAPQSSVSARRITLAISLRSDFELPLKFACKLAQEYQAVLTVIHVFDSTLPGGQAGERTPTEIASRLPNWIRKKTPVSCPLQVAVRAGDPGTEIVRHATANHQDLIIFCSTGSAAAAGACSRGVIRTVISEAHCPVLVPGQALPRLNAQEMQPHRM